MNQDEIEKLKEKVKKILSPISSTVDKKTEADKNFLFSAVRTDAGNSLPPYYIVYFLFVDLLNYKNLGRFEKVSWSVPIDYNGTPYLLEHRKFGFGLFAADKESQEAECKEIVKKISKAVVAARPYFEWFASQSVKSSDLNVMNHSYRLHRRYLFLTNEYEKKIKEAESRKDEIIRTEYSVNSWGVEIPFYRLKAEAEWLAISTIDAFYSFTEHVFIHAAILKGKLVTGEDVANLADKDWGSKFKSCLDVEDIDIKKYYDQLVSIKRQIRNYIAHGAFGKNGEAFEIHSDVGAVPLLMPHQKGNSRFSMESGIEFNEKEAIQLITKFMDFYWESNTFPEILYIQSTLPSILPYASDSTYNKAMNSVKDMEQFIEHLATASDNASNMDW
ncbi:hypothetical protein [Shewanella surugensis]|uniref:Apea-like HEPN domain-containing protein n=1 Tax=Shewanella surugensis TaxID=212020 RepID=A0ABT0LGQ8_9GAMM|nr:hypothetical protein [Shewanella surugensis]MCL1126729.1 hypothetical protein [Shewanella surugensis]